MTIRTKESLSGFLATDPELSLTRTGDARMYARVRQEHFQREEDGSFTRLESTFTDPVMFPKSAERAHAPFQNGDGVGQQQHPLRRGPYPARTRHRATGDPGA